MADPSSHVQPESVNNYYAPSEAYVHDGGVMDGQDTAFDGAWPQFVTDLPQDGDFWPQPDSQFPNSNNHTTPFYPTNGFDRPPYTNTNSYNSLGRSAFDLPPSLQSPSLSSQPFQTQPPQAQGQDDQGGTIAPNVLQAPPALQNTTAQPQAAQRQNLPPPPAAKLQYGPLVPLPKGAVVGGRFVITSTEDLAKAVSVRTLNAFVDIGQDPVAEIARSTIPVYNPRKSRNEIRALLASDSKLSASINKKTSKKLGALVKKPVKLDAAGQLAPRPASQSASDSSSEESEYESSEDEEEISPLPSRRPDTYSGATEYDAIKALWRPKLKALPVSEIRDGLKSFWEVVQTIREHWNTDRAAVKQAEEAKKMSELPMLKERVATQRGMLQIALSTAVKHGHPDIVKHFGENIAMMGAFAVFLQDRTKDSDYNGPFSRAILELLVHCTTLTDGNLEKSNIGKMLPRFIKRGDADIKALAKKISANATLATKKKAEAGKAAASGANLIKDTKAENGISKPVPAVAGVKRDRVADSTNTQPLKRVAAETPATGTLNKDINTKTSAPASTVGATAVKPKTNTVTPKASGFFSLQSASKRPGTSISSQANATKTAPAPINSAAKKSSSAPADGATQEPRSFSVFSFIEDSKKPEPKPAAKVEEKRPLETAEQKKKRERKEQRRSLRVHWKPESALVEVRLFSHDPDEELGHDASQVRDVGDIGSEGAMFKMQHRHESGVEDEEEEDEEAEAEAAKLFGREYPSLSSIDFGDLREQEPEQYNMLFEPYGGGVKKADSPESRAQEKRETDVLAVYYNKNDLSPPLTPNEPSEDIVPSEGEPQAFGEVPEHVISRLSSFERPRPAASTQPAAFDLAAILGSIGGHVPQAQTPQASAVSALDQALSQLRNGSHPVPPLPQQQQQPQSQPHFDLAAILGPLSGQQPQALPQVPPVQNGANDLAAILQGLQAAPQVPQIPGMPSLSDFMAQGGFPMMPTATPQNGGPRPSQPSGGSGYPYENEERKRWREQQGSMGGYDGNNDENEDDQHPNKRQKWNNRRSEVNDHRGGKPPPKFVVECKYFQEGKCRKGKDCTFLHDGIPAAEV